MNYDGNIDEKTSENYFVRSLYFENKFFLNFNDKVDGLKKDINLELELTLKNLTMIYFFFRAKREI